MRNNAKVSIVIPVYKPDENIFGRLKKILKNQTVKCEIVENWNMPEAVSMNTGIKNAKGEIIITLAQDCVPANNQWLEKLIKPLEDKENVVSVSDLYLPENYWKKYPFLTRVLTIKELQQRRPVMDARACAYRKRDLLKAGLFNEDPKSIGIDIDLYSKLKKMGETKYSGCKVYHLHPLNDRKQLKTIFNYAEGNGKIIKYYGGEVHGFFIRILRGVPFFGLISTISLFPYRKKKYYYLFPAFVLTSVLEHCIWVYGFWKGFLFDKESTRNTEVLKQKNSESRNRNKLQE